VNNQEDKRKIKLNSFILIVLDIFFFTIIIGTLIYYIFYFLWNFIKKHMNELKFYLSIIDLHNKLNYININIIIKNQIKEIKTEINRIKNETSKNNKTFAIPINLNLNDSTIKFEIIEVLEKMLEIQNENLIIIDIDGMLKFICNSHKLINKIKNTNESDNGFIIKTCDDKFMEGMVLALNDEIMQTLINIINSLRYKFFATIINEYTVNTRFSPITSDYHQILMQYDMLCSFEYKLNFDRDLFKILVNEMEITYSDDYKKEVLLHQIYQIFDKKILKEFKKNLTINYLFLLTKETKISPSYFLDKLYQDILIENTDTELLFETRVVFSNFLFKKEHQNNINNGKRIWKSIV
jgi:SepF-like predicted cell division protein (DUF552 family)